MHNTGILLLNDHTLSLSHHVPPGYLTNYFPPIKITKICKHIFLDPISMFKRCGELKYKANLTLLDFIKLTENAKNNQWNAENAEYNQWDENTKWLSAQNALLATGSCSLLDRVR